MYPTGVDTYSQQFRDCRQLEEAITARMPFGDPTSILFGSEVEIMPGTDGEFILHTPKDTDRSAAEYEFLTMMARLLCE